MKEIPSEAVAIRLNGFSAEFCVWLPSLSNRNTDADVFYASMVAHALSRLSYGEANDYFPLFVLVRRLCPFGLCPPIRPRLWPIMNNHITVGS